MSDFTATQAATNSPAGNRFANVAAKLSLLASLAAIVLCIFLLGGLKFHAGMRFGIVVFLLTSLLIFGGIVFGAIALVITKRREHREIFRKAVAGVCANVLLLVLLVAVPVSLLIAKYGITSQGRLNWAVKTLASASDDEDKFSALNIAAKESFEVGKIEDARGYAKELLALAPQCKGNVDYGDGIQNGNLVLGRIAVREGRIQEAGQRLLAAGNSPGCPTMDSFGPNMSLAKDLLEKGQRRVVLEYFGLCRRFWKNDFGKLDDWERKVKSGKIPDFGANLDY